MKQNTKKLLVWLHPTRDTVRWVDQSQVSWLLPKLTPAGLRSLLFLLEKKQFILVEKLSDRTLVSSTSHGQKALGEHIPAFSDERDNWDRSWTIIAFTQAPVGDKNFRYLRQVLLGVQSIPLARGLFLYPGKVPDKIMELVTQLYRSSVVIMESKNWKFGDEHEIIGRKTNMTDVVNIYSGISNELDALTRESELNNGREDQQKEHLFSIFNRLYDALSVDSGLTKHYFPQVKGGVELVGRLQQRW